jgi:transcriptional regulator with XRE-family HTH domain
MDAGKLLHDARWMAGLTQAEVAARAGITQQTVALYERGARQPSLPTLSRLVAGCGLELVCRLIPRPGLEDEPTRELLARAPFDRLDPTLSAELRKIVVANRGITLVAGGKLAARFHGANVRVEELELWLEPLVDLDALTAFLARAGVAYISPRAEVSPAVAERERLRNGWPLATHNACVYLRGAQFFDSVVQRAVPIAVPGLEFPLLVASPDDCTRWWLDRDVDHLALQRALRLAG